MTERGRIILRESYHKECPRCLLDFETYNKKKIFCSKKCLNINRDRERERGKYRERKREYARRYREKNKLKLAVYRRTYRKQYNQRPDVKEKNSKIFQEWYLRNKERHYQNIYKWRKKNRKKIYAYRFTRICREEILSIIGGECTACLSNDAIEIHHKEYIYFSTNSQKWTDAEKLLIKKNLIPLCRKCHRKQHSEERTIMFKYL